MSLVLDGSSGITTNSGTLISASTIGVGGTTASASGAGISFPATQSASTDANTLDDYEEGTWTPTISGTTNVTTSSVNFAQYTKVGRMVTCLVEVQVTFTSSNTTTAFLVSLPFTAGTGNKCFGGVSESSTFIAGAVSHNNTTSVYLAFASSASVSSGSKAVQALFSFNT